MEGGVVETRKRRGPPPKQLIRMFWLLQENPHLTDLELSNNKSEMAHAKHLSNRQNCHGCKRLTLLDSQPFCSLLQSFLAPETWGQLCLDFEEEKHR